MKLSHNFLLIIIYWMLLHTSDSKKRSTCNGFMSLLLKEQHFQMTTSSEINDRLKVLSLVMQSLGEKLTIFSNFQPTSAKYSNIVIQFIDVDQLFIDYGFKKVLPVLKSWSDLGSTLHSDIVRYLLAHRYRLTFIDIGIHLLSTNRNEFMHDFVTVYLWGNEGAALEMSTDAFCLPKKKLRVIINRILNRLSTMKNLNTLHSKEFSSTMLPKVIFNRFEVSLYSTNHPNQTNYHEIMEYMTIFKHKFTYESPFLRSVWGEKYFNICNEIRSFLNLSLLSNRSLLEIET